MTLDINGLLRELYATTDIKFKFRFDVEDVYIIEFDSRLLDISMIELINKYAEVQYIITSDDKLSISICDH